MQEFREQNMEGFLHLLSDFEKKKQFIKPKQHNSKQLNIRIPVDFNDVVETVTGKTITETIQESKYNGKVNAVKRDLLRLDVDIALSFFEDAVEKILDYVHDILNNPAASGCQTIVMVGGFCESEVLQAKIRERFPQMKVIAPDQAGLAVLKGAVIFGHEST